MKTSWTMSSRPPFHNMRSYTRRSVNWPAQVRMAGRPTISCVVKDISEQGALLEFRGRSPLTNRFRLTIAENGFDRICHVRHRKLRTVGVQF